MAYKGKSVVVASASHLISELKDFMITCGWALEGPSAGTGPADNDDLEGLILGWFLSSAGEDTAQDLHVHLGVAKEARLPDFADFSYLAEAGGISDSDDNFDVKTGTGSKFTAGDKIRIEDEIIVVGGVSTDRLTGCQRGWGITDPAAHAQNKVIQFVESPTHNALPMMEGFAFSDLATALLTSNGNSAGWTATEANFDEDSVLDNSGYWTNDRFNYHCLLENVVDGKLRWITDYVAATGTFTHQDFLATPTAASTAKVYVGGFLPGWSKRAYQGGTYADRHLGIFGPYAESGSPWATKFHHEAGVVVWMYGSKDGVMLVANWPVLGYEAFYIGNCVPYSSPLNTTLSSGATAGDVVIDVTSVASFTEGQKVRIIAQSIADWNTNEDRSAESPAASWPNLDPEEIPTEEALIVAVGVSDITVATGLIYTYSSGAVIGEDPRPMVRLGNYGGSVAANAKWDNSGIVIAALYNTAPKNSISQHATHRQFSRSFHSDSARYTPLWMDGNSLEEASSIALHKLDTNLLKPADDAVMNYDIPTYEGNYQNEQLLMSRWIVQRTVTTKYDHGSWTVGKGVIPFCWCNTQDVPPLGGSSEDTVEAMWAGTFETFRMFDVNGEYLIVGPEIA